MGERKRRVGKKGEKEAGKGTAKGHIKAYLVVMAGPRFGESLALNKGKNVVGTDARADIYFPTDKMMGHHFDLSCTDKAVLKKKEGEVFVNNTPVKEMCLKDGDLIRVAGILLQYVEKGSQPVFFVGKQLYRVNGHDRRCFPRFAAPATVDLFIVEQELKFKGLPIRDVGRGGVALFSNENISPGSEVTVSLLAKDQGHEIHAEEIPATVVTATPWKESVLLLGVLFHKPVSENNHPVFHSYLKGLEKSD